VKTTRSIEHAAVVLVDTSVWIDVFRKPSKVQLEEIVEFDSIITCLPVIQEVLQGFDSEHAFLRARQSMLAFPIVESPVRRDVFLQAADLYRSARRAGYTIRSTVDCLIGACAIRNQLEVLHLDRDFDVIAKIAPLKVRNVRTRSSGR
jgi:predicted nucleic acid-binding protein